MGRQVLMCLFHLRFTEAFVSSHTIGCWGVWECVCMYSSHILLQLFGSAQVSADVTDLRTALALATAAECEEVAAQIRNDLAESKRKDRAPEQPFRL